MELSTWGIVFHTLHTEQFVSNVLNRYNTLCSLIPMNKRATIEVNMQLLSHSTLVPVMDKPSPADSDKTTYSYALQTMWECEPNGT